MNKAEEKAKILMDAIALYKIELSAKHGRMIEQAVTKLLKEQDRDTRHACAEAVLGCPEDMSASDLKTSVHNACINVKAV